jgi:2-polyprenyl-3-methyl-5-hydroxy-6-metoxy-1,4-benzoquinol methylase
MIAMDSLYTTGANSEMIKYSFQVFRPYIEPGAILELGPAEGVMTELIVSLGNPLTVVDGSSVFCERLKENYPLIDVVHSLFEDFYTGKKFQTIILGHVLEHVDDPVAVLKHIKQFLQEDGVVLAAVPNANSIHRQAAVLMGFISSKKDFSELDKHHGHQRIYTIEEFEYDFKLAGFDVKKLGGYWLKPLSNAQIEKDWTPEMILAFMRLGEKYPEIAAEIYIVAGK